MVNTRTTRGSASQQGSPSTGLGEVPDSQFGTATVQAQGTPQGENHEAILATVERLVRERLAQQPQVQHHTPQVHVMRGNKPQPFYGKSRSEFEEFVRVCE